MVVSLYDHAATVLYLRSEAFLPNAVLLNHKDTAVVATSSALAMAGAVVGADESGAVSDDMTKIYGSDEWRWLFVEQVLWLHAWFCSEEMKINNNWSLA